VPRPPSGLRLDVALALMNLFIVAVVLAAFRPVRLARLDIATLVALIAIVPARVVGAVLERATRAAPRACR
jgi:hypothetical protein